MISLNRSILAGYVGCNPETRYLKDGTAVARFTLATTEVVNGVRQPVDWHYIVLWRGLAEQASRLVYKGAAVYVEGRMKTRRWYDDNGFCHSVTEVVANNFSVVAAAKNVDEPQLEKKDEGSLVSNDIDNIPGNLQGEILPF